MPNFPRPTRSIQAQGEGQKSGACEEHQPARGGPHPHPSPPTHPRPPPPTPRPVHAPSGRPISKSLRHHLRERPASDPTGAAGGIHQGAVHRRVRLAKSSGAKNFAPVRLVFSRESFSRRMHALAPPLSRLLRPRARHRGRARAYRRRRRCCWRRRGAGGSGPRRLSWRQRARRVLPHSQRRSWQCCAKRFAGRAVCCGGREGGLAQQTEGEKKQVGGGNVIQLLLLSRARPGLRASPQRTRRSLTRNVQRNRQGRGYSWIQGQGGGAKGEGGEAAK